MLGQPKSSVLPKSRMLPCSPWGFSLVWVVRLLGTVPRLNFIPQIINPSAFCLRENPACMFQDPKFLPWENRHYAVSFPCPFLPLWWWLVARGTPPGKSSPRWWDECCNRLLLRLEDVVAASRCPTVAGRARAAARAPSSIPEQLKADMGTDEQHSMDSVLLPSRCPEYWGSNTYFPDPGRLLPIPCYELCLVHPRTGLCFDTILSIPVLHHILQEAFFLLLLLLLLFCPPSPSGYSFVLYPKQFSIVWSYFVFIW